MSASFSHDINGLRAVAVLVVMLFHFGVPGMAGGFVGVDIFFVISGFLMTGILQRRMDAGRFSLFGFYMDRVRRIVPALLGLCVALFVVGWFVLLPSEFQRLGKQVAASTVFLSNLVFWREAGYFDINSHSKWLLHTWSLSVEWQFYLLYPLLLLALRRVLGAPRLARGVAVLALVSFAAAVYACTRWPSAAFFLLPFRAWEMLAGGLVALCPFPAWRIGRLRTEQLGLALLALALVLVDARTDWPGWKALLPVVGTALVIWAGREQSRLLGHPVAQYLGRISYSLYLWHWPVEVALRRYEVDHAVPLALHVALGTVLALGLAVLSYRLVESPGRRADRGAPAAQQPAAPWRREVLRFGVAVLATGTAGVGIWGVHGAPSRFSDAVRIADQEVTDVNPYSNRCFSTFGAAAPSCLIGPGAGPAKAVMIGDSHALSVATALAEAIAQRGDGRLLFQGYASCPTLQGATYGARSELKCYEFNRTYLDPMIQGEPSTVPLVITNYWNNYLEAPEVRFVSQPGVNDAGVSFSADTYHRQFTETVCALARKRPVYLTRPFPEFPENVPHVMARRLMDDPHSADLRLPVDEYRRRNATVTAWMEEVHSRCGVHLLDPAPYLCPDGSCMGSYEGRPLYKDRHHLTEYGNRFLVPMFRQVFEASAPSPSPVVAATP